MTIVVNQKLCELLPLGLRRRARLKLGDRLEVKASGGVITMIAKLPSADDEYTPAQRRIIHAQLAEAEEDIRAGRIIGPFNTADEMIASMKSQLKKKAPARKPKRPSKACTQRSMTRNETSGRRASTVPGDSISRSSTTPT